MDSILAGKRRYSIHPTSPLRPILLFLYPKGLAWAACSFSSSGKEKNFAAAASNLSMNSNGIPWLITLKNPTSSHALTRRNSESGSDRSMVGILEKKLGLCFLIKDIWSSSSTMVIYERSCRKTEENEGVLEERNGSEMGVGD